MDRLRTRLRRVGLLAARSISMSNSRAIHRRSRSVMSWSWARVSTRPAIRSSAATVILWVANRASIARSAAPVSPHFFTTPGYDGWSLVMLRLAEVDVERLAEPDGLPSAELG
jgi:hypothetical protein